jgi:hypothetical protein
MFDFQNDTAYIDGCGEYKVSNMKLPLEVSKLFTTINISTT